MSNVAVVNRLGKNVSDAKNAREAFEIAGVNWEVVPDDVYVRPQGDEGQAIVVPGVKALRRSDNGNVLSIMSDRYRAVSRTTQADYLDTLAQEVGLTYDRIMSINGGKRLIITAKLQNPIQVGPDTIERYLTLFDSVDGTLAFGGAISPLRVVCQNMLNALMRKAESMFKFRHSVNVTNRIAEARRALGLVERSYTSFQETANRLLATKMSDAQAVQAALALFPQKGDEDSEVGARLTKSRDAVVRLFTEGAGHGPIRGTAWAFYNGVAEYVDHHRTGRVSTGREKAESSLDSVLFGSGAQLKQKALHLLAA